MVIYHWWYSRYRSSFTAEQKMLQLCSLNVDYDFDGKYLCSMHCMEWFFSIGANNKYEFAKGASVGWNVTRESFASNVVE
jgi:hypothetical protein